MKLTLTTQFSARRVILFIGLTFIAALLTFLFLSSTSNPITIKDGNVTIYFAAARTEYFPQDCVNFTWNVDHTQVVYFNNEGVAGSGNRELCSFNDISATLRVIYVDGSVHSYVLSTRMLLDNEGVFTLLTFTLLSIALAIALFIPTPQDYLLITLLVFIPAIPLFLLRGTALFENNLVQAVFWLVWLLVAALWLKRDTGQSHMQAKKSSFKRAVMLSFLLLIFTVVGFYVPMKQHFYTGGIDDARALLQMGRPLWSEVFDATQGRPLSDLNLSLIFFLSPNSLDGFLWVALFERFLQAALIFALARSFFPYPRSSVPIIAALLFIVWPAELSRYITLANRNYHVSVLLLTLALVLFIRSYIRRQRLLLIIACLMLGVSILVVETALVLILILPGLLLLLPKRRHFLLWCYAWYATIGLFGARLAVLLLGGASYQTGRVGRGGFLVEVPSNLWNLSVKPFFAFLQYPAAIVPYALYGLLLVGIAVIVLWRHKQASLLPRLSYFVGIGLAAVATLLVVFPYFPLNGSSGDLGKQPLVRSQFFTSPIQVIVWALLIELVGVSLFRRFRRVWIVMATAVIVMFAITGDLAFQAGNGFLEPQVTFAELKQNLQVIAHQLPTMTPNSVIVLNMQDDVDTPFGDGFHLLTVSCLAFGHPAYEGKFTTDGFNVYYGGHPPQVTYAPTFNIFSHPIVFNVSKDWNITPMAAPIITPSSRTQPASSDCQDALGGPDFWPPVTTYDGPGFRFFH